MNRQAETLLKNLLWLVCAFHIAVGVILNLPLGLERWVASGLYGATVDWGQAEFVYILKPLGAFMIALGLMAGIAARNPLAHRGIVRVFAILFVLRGLQRVVFLREIQDVFAIPLTRHFGTMVFMVLLAIALLVLQMRAGSRTAGA